MVVVVLVEVVTLTEDCVGVDRVGVPVGVVVVVVALTAEEEQAELTPSLLDLV